MNPCLQKMRCPRKTWHQLLVSSCVYSHAHKPTGTGTYTTHAMHSLTWYKYTKYYTHTMHITYTPHTPHTYTHIIPKQLSSYPELTAYPCMIWQSGPNSPAVKLCAHRGDHRPPTQEEQLHPSHPHPSSSRSWWLSEPPSGLLKSQVPGPHSIRVCGVEPGVWIF